jgi:hypothetical protein
VEAVAVIVLIGIGGFTPVSAQGRAEIQGSAGRKPEARGEAAFRTPN